MKNGKDQAIFTLLGGAEVDPADCKCQRKTKGRQLKGKIVSAFFHTFFALFHASSHFFTLFHTFSEFSPRAILKIQAFFFTEPFCTLVVARLSSSKVVLGSTVHLK